MKSLRLTLIAAACGMALAACSSDDGPRRLPDQSAIQTEAQKKAEKAEQDLKQAKDNLATKESEVKNKEQEILALKNQIDLLKADTDKQKELENKIEELSKQIEQLKADKEKLETAKAELLPIVEEYNKVKAAENAQKLEENRIALNKEQLKKGFIDNGADSDNVSYVSGSIIEIDGNQLKFHNVPTQSKKLNELVVDGKTVTLFDVESVKAYQQEDKTKNEIFDIKDNNLNGKMGSLPTRRIGDDFAQVRFGYVKNAEGKTFLFVQGHQTPTDKNLQTPFNYWSYASDSDSTDGLRVLPTSGTFDYKGYAFYGKDGDYKQYDVAAVTDLNNKKVKVDIQDGEMTKLTLGANITGNVFVGNYQGVETKGAFYGTNGRDIAGTFYQTTGTEKDANGVFGATKQGCGYSSCTESKTSLENFAVE